MNIFFARPNKNLWISVAQIKWDKNVVAHTVGIMIFSVGNETKGGCARRRAARAESPTVRDDGKEKNAIIVNE